MSGLMISPFYLFLGLAVILLAVEIFILQMSTGLLLFAGLGALITALALWYFELDGWVGTLAIFIGSTLVLTLLLRRQLRHMRAFRAGAHGINVVGAKAVVTAEITQTTPGKVKWSGADWTAELAEGVPVDRIEVGARVEVRETQNLTLLVAPTGGTAQPVAESGK